MAGHPQCCLIPLCVFWHEVLPLNSDNSVSTSPHPRLVHHPICYVLEILNLYFSLCVALVSFSHSLSCPVIFILTLLDWPLSWVSYPPLSWTRLSTTDLLHMHKSLLASASHTPIWQALLATLTPGHHTSPVLELHRPHSADARRHHYRSKLRHSCMQLVRTALSRTTFTNTLRTPSLSSRLMHAVSSHPHQHCLSDSSY